MRQAVVWGLGRFGGGLGAVLHLHATGHCVRVVDRASAADLALTLESIRDAGGPKSLELCPESPEAFDDADLVVVNPGIRPSHPVLTALEAREVRCTQELDLFLEAYPGRIVAITGTNGKSTTAAMIAAVLRAHTPAPDSVLLGGNIGRSLLVDHDAWRRDQWAVLEVSSFQAARLDTRVRRLSAAVFTKITRDHLDWHGTEAAYRNAKLRLADAVAAGGLLVGHADCAAFSGLRERHRGSMAVRAIGQDGTAPRASDGSITLGDEELLSEEDLRLRGRFNLENAALALAATMHFGASAAVAVRALQELEALPHRLEELGRRHGVLFIDNGVSTVAETSRAALETYRGSGHVHWVCGGRRKEPDLGAIARLAPLATTVHVFGEVAPELGTLMRRHGARPVTAHRHQRQALDAAWEHCNSGDILLSSPAFASHDQYPNFRERALEARSWWGALHRPPGRDSLGSDES